jgi:hypothetical protein
MHPFIGISTKLGKLIVPHGYHGVWWRSDNKVDRHISVSNFLQRLAIPYDKQMFRLHAYRMLYSFLGLSQYGDLHFGQTLGCASFLGIHS